MQELDHAPVVAPECAVFTITSKFIQRVNSGGESLLRLPGKQFCNTL
jgi:hypothetical protein